MSPVPHHLHPTPCSKAKPLRNSISFCFSLSFLLSLRAKCLRPQDLAKLTSQLAGTRASGCAKVLIGLFWPAGSQWENHDTWRQQDSGGVTKRVKGYCGEGRLPRVVCRPLLHWNLLFSPELDELFHSISHFCTLEYIFVVVVVFLQASLV